MSYSRKQYIYEEMLWVTLPYARNVQTWSRWRRLFHDSCLLELELIHNLPVVLLVEEFSSHDIWFLNHQARWYLEQAAKKPSPNYSTHRSLIAELFSLVPAEMRSALEWSGPG